MKHLEPIHLKQQSDYHYTTYCIGAGKAAPLPEGTTLADLFRPQFWGNHHKTLNVGDLVRVRANDGAFDIMLTVIAKDVGGVVMDIWPKFPNAADLEMAAGLQAVAADVRPVLVPATVHGKPVPRVDFTKATGWRVIALDGNVHSEGYPSQAAAHKAMTDYLQRLKIERMADEPEAAAAPTKAGALKGSTKLARPGKSGAETADGGSAAATV